MHPDACLILEHKHSGGTRFAHYPKNHEIHSSLRKIIFQRHHAIDAQSVGCVCFFLVHNVYHKGVFCIRKRLDFSDS